MIRHIKTMLKFYCMMNALDEEMQTRVVLTKI